MDKYTSNLSRKITEEYQKLLKERIGKAGHIVVYTKDCECIKERYGSLECFWERVKVSIIPRFDCMVAMVLHDDENPHIHLILKTEECIEKCRLAFGFNEVSFRDDYSCDIFEDAFTYYFQPLEEVYDTLIRTSNALALGMTPDFADYIIKAKSL